MRRVSTITVYFPESDEDACERAKAFIRREEGTWTPFFAADVVERSSDKPMATAYVQVEYEAR